MLPMTRNPFCSKCGRRILFDALPDLESDREYPDYYHYGCMFGGLNEKTEQPGNTGLPPQSGEKG